MTTATLTKTKTIEFERVMKDFKKFVSRSEAQPVLQNVDYDGKYLTATDGHVMIRLNAECVENIPSNEPFQYDPRNMEIVPNPDNFPQVDRLISREGEWKSIVTLNNSNLKDFQDHIKEAKKVVKGVRNKVVKLNFTQSDTTITGKPNSDDEKEYNETINSTYVEGEDIIIKANAKLLNDTLTTIKKLNKLTNTDITLSMNGHLRPIHFHKEDVFDILVCPIRSF